jgi:hypothetical protein
MLLAWQAVRIGCELGGVTIGVGGVMGDDGYEGTASVLRDVF